MKTKPAKKKKYTRPPSAKMLKHLRRVARLNHERAVQRRLAKAKGHTKARTTKKA